IGVNPLQSGNTTLLLWMMMGFMVVTAVLVVSFGRLGDMFGRVRLFNMGFAIFSFFSVLLSVSWLTGTGAAWYLIIMRVLQGVGGAMLFANSSAILTDAFPANKRGMALGLNQVSAIAGSFIAVLVGITYGIQPYGSHVMGWTSPLVLSLIGGGLVVLAAFCFIETRVAEPANRRGVGAGMSATFQNSAMVLSIGIFFTLIILGLSASLPAQLMTGLTAQGVPASAAHQLASLPPTAVMFAALLGYNPIQMLLGSALTKLPAGHAAYLTGHSFFPSLISGPFHSGLEIAFDFAIAACLIAAVASLLRGRKYVHDDLAGADVTPVAIAEEIQDPSERRQAAPEPATRFRKEN
ncbi:MAG TPA: MFS transporter, partial [Trebonia sp.]